MRRTSLMKKSARAMALALALSMSVQSFGTTGMAVLVSAAETQATDSVSDETQKPLQERLAYVGEQTWAGTTTEMEYSRDGSTWTACLEGQTKVTGETKGSVSFRYKGSGGIWTIDQIQEGGSSGWSGGYHKIYRVDESEYGSIKLTYNGIETQWFAKDPDNKEKNEQWPQIEVTPENGWICKKVKIYINGKDQSYNSLGWKEVEVKDNKVELSLKGTMTSYNEICIRAIYEVAPYTITVEDTTGGSVKVSAEDMAGYENDEIIITATPDEDYVLKSLVVKDAKGNDVTVTENKFAMPKSNVSITASFELKDDVKKELEDMIGLIDAIGEVSYTDECKKAIEAARSAYNKLSERQQGRISEEKLAILTKAEADYKALEKKAEDEKKAEEEKKAKDQEAANAVIKALDAIGTVAYSKESKALIDAARKAYDALTADQKALVSAEKLAVLTKAETDYKALEKKAEEDKNNNKSEDKTTEADKNQDETAVTKEVLAQTKATKTSATITWVKDANATAGYRIYIKGGQYKKYTKVADVAAGKNTYSIKKAKKKVLASGTKYSVKVVSLVLNNGKKVEKTAQKLNVVTLTKAPAIASAKRSKNGKNISLTWKKVSGANGYEIQMSTNKKTGFKKVKAVSAKTKKLTKKNVKASKTYYFRMRTYKTANGKKFYSSWSTVKKVSKAK